MAKSGKPEKNTIAIQELLVKNLTPTNQRSRVHKHAMCLKIHFIYNAWMSN